MVDRKFNPKWKKGLDNPKRRSTLDPDKIIPLLGIEKGHVVADIGAGTGYFTFPIAEKVGENGKVFAVDVSQDMLGTLKENLIKYGFVNVEPVLSKEERIPLPDNSVDVAILVAVLHELKGDGTLKEARRILRDGGKLIIIDWKKKMELKGPPSFIRLKVPKAIEKCERTGFKFQKNIMSGPSHFSLIFCKNNKN